MAKTDIENTQDTNAIGVVCSAIVRLPVSAIRRAFGDWMWFIQDADGMPIAQIMPSTNEAVCKELVRLINLGVSEPNAELCGNLLSAAAPVRLKT